MEREEAIKIVKSHYPANKQMLNEALEFLIPELKESENERIRKALVRFHKSTIDVDGIKGEEILAWLEKQGNNSNQNWKPTKEQINALEHFVRSIAESGYASPYDDNTKLLKSLINDLYKLEKQGEKKPTEWSEDDERIITALMEGFRYHQLFNPRFGEVPNAEIISWIKSLKERLS